MIDGFVLRRLALAAAALLSACGTATKRAPKYHDGAPPKSVDISQIKEPIPKFEPLAHYGNHSPYTVLGKQYQVLPTRVGYRERGIASWYGTKFHGRLTSNREPYDMYSFTAAHKTLPLPSFARVTNLSNQRSIIVRINDRGPFVGDRVIDLSYVAAVKLGIHIQGTGVVQVETITPDESAPPRIAAHAANAASLQPTSTPAEAKQARQEGGFLLQCGAFSDFANAGTLKVKLLDAGFSDARVSTGEDGLHRILLGPLISLADAQDLSLELLAKGFSQPKVLSPQ
jgi:rare lipoprotein A